MDFTPAYPIAEPRTARLRNPSQLRSAVPWLSQQAAAERRDSSLSQREGAALRCPDKRAIGIYLATRTGAGARAPNKSSTSLTAMMRPTCLAGHSSSSDAAPPIEACEQVVELGRGNDHEFVGWRPRQELFDGPQTCLRIWRVAHKAALTGRIRYDSPLAIKSRWLPVTFFGSLPGPECGTGFMRKWNFLQAGRLN